MFNRSILLCYGFSCFCFFSVSEPDLFADITSSSLNAVPSALAEKSDFKQSLQKAKKLAAEKQWVKAKRIYQKLFQQARKPEDRERIKSRIQELNVRILFSPVITEDKYIYKVRDGDSLYPLARKLGTTAELIQKNNRLRDNTIEPGMKLKITKAKFSIRVDKSRNTLDLYRDGEIFKTYPVSTGRNNSTPVGKFVIKNKSVNPDWYKDGKKIPAGSPGNILGTRWLGFDLAHYGIHGTTLPETIGKQASDGCVRMLNRDVEELYMIVPEKTRVTVID